MIKVLQTHFDIFTVDLNENFNDLDDILADNFSPEPAKNSNKNNTDSLDFDNSDDLNNIIEKYETMLNQPQVKVVSKNQKLP